MSVQSPTLEITEALAEDPVLATRHGVVARLSDPFLTDHDRWVLGQFARFLGGQMPEPDPRVVPRQRQTRGNLPSRVRRATL
jgi:hypothetical protein